MDEPTPTNKILMTFGKLICTGMWGGIGYKMKSIMSPTIAFGIVLVICILADIALAYYIFNINHPKNLLYSIPFTIFTIAISVIIIYYIILHPTKKNDDDNDD